MADPLLVTDKLTKDYGTFRALDTLDLTIPRGEIFGLLGPNGSGKSTAIRLALGFIRPTSGTVRIAGFDAWMHSVEVRQRVAYLPGELRLYENMSGRQIIRFLAKVRGETFDTGIEVLARRFDIDIDRPLTQMSSGMKRKIALLAVLTPKVPLVILDEPTNTLDPTMRDELLEQLLLARARGQTILFSSHVLSEVEHVCDRVGILKQGKLVQLQPMADLRKEGRFVFARFVTVPAVDPEGKPIPSDAIQTDGSIELHHRGALADLLRWLERHTPLDVRIEPLGLAPIYHRHHGHDV